MTKERRALRSVLNGLFVCLHHHRLPWWQVPFPHLAADLAARCAASAVFFRPFKTFKSLRPVAGFLPDGMPQPRLHVRRLVHDFVVRHEPQRTLRLPREAGHPQGGQRELAAARMGIAMRKIVNGLRPTGQ